MSILEDVVKSSNRFVTKSFLGALSFFKEALYNEEYSAAPGLLQRFDPRVKLIAFCAALIAIAFIKSITSLVLIYVATILLAYLSRIHVVYFLKRVWIFIPLFAVVIAVPAIFSIFTPGDPIMSLKIFSWSLTVTVQGVKSAFVFVLRVASSVSLVVLLALTTRHTTLLAAVRFFKISPVFTMTLEMTYRFLFLLVKNIEEMFMGIESRTVRKMGGRQGRRIVARRIGTLWEKSRGMSEDVYLAMVARGYTGEPKTLSDGKKKNLPFP